MTIEEQMSWHNKHPAIMLIMVYFILLKQPMLRLPTWERPNRNPLFRPLNGNFYMQAKARIGGSSIFVIYKILAKGWKIWFGGCLWNGSWYMGLLMDFLWYYFQVQKVSPKSAWRGSNKHGRYKIIALRICMADGVLTSSLGRTWCKLFFGTQALPKNRGACVDTSFWHSDEHVENDLKMTRKSQT